MVGKEGERAVCVGGRWVLTRVEAPTGRGGGRGSSGISSDGVDRRIFGGFKFSIPGFSWVGKFGKYSFFEGKQKLLRFLREIRVIVTKGKLCEGNPREIDFGSSFMIARGSSLSESPGGGGTPIHYLYGYVPPNGVVILKLLI